MKPRLISIENQAFSSTYWENKFSCLLLEVVNIILSFLSKIYGLSHNVDKRHFFFLSGGLTE